MKNCSLFFFPFLLWQLASFQSGGYFVFLFFSAQNHSQSCCLFREQRTRATSPHWECSGRWLCLLGTWQSSIKGVPWYHLNTRTWCKPDIQPLQMPVQWVEICISNMRSGYFCAKNKAKLQVWVSFYVRGHLSGHLSLALPRTQGARTGLWLRQPSHFPSVCFTSLIWKRGNSNISFSLRVLWKWAVCWL